MSGFAAVDRSGARTGSQEPSIPARTTSCWICHMPEARSDASTTDGSPVVARRNSAVPTAPAIVSPPTTSPNAGRAVGGHVASGGVSRCCIPLRAQ
jgi:hypothetical protein